MKTIPCAILLFSMILCSCSTLARQQEIIDIDSKQIYVLTFDHLKRETADGNYMKEIVVATNWITWGQNFLYDIKTHPVIGDYLKLDDWKFVLKTDTSQYDPKAGFMVVQSKKILGKSIKITAPSAYWYSASPIVFNEQEDKAYLYYYIWANDSLGVGPVLLLFSKEKKEWKLVAESISPLY